MDDPFAVLAGEEAGEGGVFAGVGEWHGLVIGAGGGEQAGEGGREPAGGASDGAGGHQNLIREPTVKPVIGSTFAAPSRFSS